MLIVLIIIILVILVILASILMIPFHISLNLKNQGIEYKGYFQLTWMKIRLVKREIPSEEEKEKEKKEKKEKAEWTLSRIQKVLNLFSESLPYFERIIRAFIRSISLEKFYLNLTLGLDSPVDTAMLSGLFWSLASVINTIPKVSINMKPQFMENRFDGQFEIELKIKLLWIVVEALRAYSKKPVRNFISEVRA